jgi:hypothetical protein
MVLALRKNDLLRLRRAAGTWIEVLSGRIWVTEDGRAGDFLLGPGRGYRVFGDGLVLLGTETLANGNDGAEIMMRQAGRHERSGDAAG